ncbi:VPLPA-CTERM sorting domain-containing protein [Sneathiella limimaris]|uniref:VPLPA-CTERM sorting domain-containing protein n=1 Tax=Sneathiella limimaris TaxID=1964213 RepID=UPI0019D05A94|nr:VPLPA-CTERM sorting domain-containing protein [Sneathiella limimaris]
MKQLKVISLLFAFLTFGFSAHATTIDFLSMANGNVSTIGDATFALSGAGEAGDPYVSSSYGGGLWNSSDAAAYPTNTILSVTFDTTATNLSWYFDNEGSKSTTWTLFDSSNSILASGFNNTSSGMQLNDQSSYTGVKRIEWNNNGNNWLFALGSISYRAELSTVPLPAAAWLFGAALMGLVGFKRYRKA